MTHGNAHVDVDDVKHTEVWTMIDSHADMTAVETWYMIAEARKRAITDAEQRNAWSVFTHLLEAGAIEVTGSRPCLITGNKARTYRTLPRPWTRPGKKPTAKQELAGRVLAFLKSGEILEAAGLCAEALKRELGVTEAHDMLKITATLVPVAPTTPPTPPKHSSVFPHAAMRPLAALKDAPQGFSHRCPTCGALTTLVENARAHVWRTNHPDPVLVLTPLKNGKVA